MISCSCWKALSNLYIFFLYILVAANQVFIILPKRTCIHGSRTSQFSTVEWADLFFFFLSIQARHKILRTIYEVLNRFESLTCPHFSHGTLKRRRQCFSIKNTKKRRVDKLGAAEAGTCSRERVQVVSWDSYCR